MRVSIILPTFNERKNLSRLVKKIFAIRPKTELIIIDDKSPDGTGRLADKLAKEYPLKVIHRKRRLGLSTAVIEGFKVAKGNIIGVMDADLSHPPELIPSLIEPIIKNKSDFVIGSRIIKGGSVEVWPFHRKLISRTATLMAKPLTLIKDPLSGFFFLKRDIINNINFASRGYKICLEIIVKGRYKNIIEVPYIFRTRTVGASKLNAKEYFNYFIDWVNLIKYVLRRK
ncbi:MAG: polyprenol monophosphomannose synthase [Candidatus Thorarchaeota archaeon]